MSSEFSSSMNLIPCTQTIITPSDMQLPMDTCPWYDICTRVAQTFVPSKTLPCRFVHERNEKEPPPPVISVVQRCE